MAAVLACGLRAVLSHRSAAALLDLRRAGTVIEVTVPGRGGRKVPAGVRLHRTTTLTPRDVAVVRGIPVTTPARTIIDLARTTSGRQLEQLIDRADQRGLIDFADLRAATPASLKAVLRSYRGVTTRSELEERFLRLCDDHGIDRPETNAIIEGLEVDFVWRAERLIVEVDGYAYHRSPSDFERDRERDVHLQTHGWRVLRFTWHQLTDRPEWAAHALLRACAPARSPAARTRPGRSRRRTGRAG
jgi:very-short-patch-repair endonuclease